MDKNHKWKYNYILYNMETAYKWQMYGDLRKLNFVRMCRGALPLNQPLLHKIHKLHWSAKMNSKVNLPLKKLWLKKMTDGKFGDNKPVCYVFFGGQYILRYPQIADYIKKLNPENKIAIHYRDILKSEAKKLHILKSKSDLMYTYDKGEAEKYGMEYDSSYVYSRLAETTEPEEFDYDLFFVGYAKDRLDLILGIAKNAVKNGVTCKFLIVGVEDSLKEAIPGVEYLNSTIPYKEVIDYVGKSRCILEVTQGNAEGATMRTAEALLYKRKLLTNCNRAQERPDFNPLVMNTFTDENDINYDFLKEPIPYEKLTNTESFSPVNELLRLEEYFTKGTGFDKIR